jgi:hypothetical protein
LARRRIPPGWVVMDAAIWACSHDERQRGRALKTGCGTMPSAVISR